MSSQLSRKSTNGEAPSAVFCSNNLQVQGDTAMAGNLSVLGELFFANPPVVTYPVVAGTNCSYLRLGNLVLVFGQAQNAIDGSFTFSGFPGNVLNTAVAIPSSGNNCSTVQFQSSSFSPCTFDPVTGLPNANASGRFVCLQGEAINLSAPTNLIPFTGQNVMYAIMFCTINPPA